ncbi:putative MFS family arabinose efflux permease [Frondihabitans sp. PhB188]|uniref:MFS transporter n=1 Tax=Frondihabitans sp. PhB188 TaxID=2485200 RepID=UPI000F4AB6CB|nr:MFS transporter [Frondihabitans sp. PhB188]ROQ36570.1 putative MFS family arabinose efflux permease [Frondihabitans sp. PhB188]
MHELEPTLPDLREGGPRRFAALRNRDSRPYLFTSGLSMMADNTEHVITYWVLWQTFHSPALVGFQIISHWLPFLLLSVWSGSLAEKYDCRKIIQAGQVLFMLVSIGWGTLFVTHSLTVWAACILLVLHGVAGTLWAPAEQLLLHDFVERRDLPSAVRMNATFQSVGLLLGPVVGSALLLWLGPIGGIYANVLIYLPMTILMIRTKFTGHIRDAADLEKAPRVTLRDTLLVLGRIRSNHLIIAMIVISGLMAITIGNALPSSMPVFAERLGAGSSGDLTYGSLLFAMGIGGVVGGFLLEATGVAKPNLRTAVVATIVFGGAIAAFALTGSFVLALIALVVAGVGEIASMSTAQSVVQLEAPSAERGRTLGVYGMFASGLRTGGGVTLGVAGATVGVVPAIGILAGILVVGAVVAAVYAARQRQRPVLPT